MGRKWTGICDGKLKRAASIYMFEKSHKSTQIFTKLILLSQLSRLLTTSIIRGYSCPFVAKQVFKRVIHIYSQCQLSSQI